MSVEPVMYVIYLPNITLTGYLGQTCNRKLQEEYAFVVCWLQTGADMYGLKNPSIYQHQSLSLQINLAPRWPKIVVLWG